MSNVKMEIVLAAKDVTARSFASVEKKISGLKSSVLSLNKIMVGVAAATGVGFFIKKNLEAADAIAKTADSVGLSTNALQQWQFIADRSGVSAGQLEKGVGAFAKRIGELRAGTGALNTYLNKTNKELKNQLTATHSTSEALNIFLQALAGIKNQSDRVALSTAAFSRTAGIKFTNLVQSGTAGLAEMKKEFADLGIAIDDKFLRQSEKAIDQFTNLEFVIKSKLMQVVVQFAPEITKVTQEMVKWIKKNDDLIKQNLSEYLHGVANRVSKIYDILEKINSLYMSLPESVRGPMGIGLIGTILFGRTGGVLLSLFCKIEQETETMLGKLKVLYKNVEQGLPFTGYEKEKPLSFPINNQTPGYDLYDNSEPKITGNSEGNSNLSDLKLSDKLLKDLQDQYYKLTDSKIQALNRWKQSELAAAVKIADGDKTAYATLAQWIGKVYNVKLSDLNKQRTDAEHKQATKAYENFKAILDKKIQAQQEANDELKRAGKEVWEATRTALEEYNLKLKELANLYKKGAIDLDTYNRATKEAAQSLSDFQQQNDKTMQEINNFSTHAFSSMEDAWVSFCTTGKISFSNFAKSVIADIARIEFEKSITNTFKPGLNSWLSKGVGFLFGTSGSSGPSSLPDGSIPMSAEDTIVYQMHTGGIAGSDTPQNSSFMSTAMMASSPRFHAGLLPNEFPAILQKGEGVFTQKQMAALGQQNTAPAVQVNVINNTGTDADVKQQKPKWDGEKWVIGVVLDAMNRNKGGFRTNLKSAMVK